MKPHPESEDLLEDLIMAPLPKKLRPQNISEPTQNKISVDVRPDRLDSIIKIASTILTVGALLLAVFEFRHSTDQRSRELRFQQATFGKELVDSVLSDEEAWQALTMIDYGNQGREFEIVNGENIIIRTRDITDALRLEKYPLTEKDIFVRERIDRLFFLIGRIQSSIEIELTKEEDVLFPLDYYSLVMCEYREDIQNYLRQGSSYETSRFLERRWAGC